MQRDALPNVIVLTTGLTGSSVLSGLLARAGYWTGDETFRKPDYNTYENRRLVELNSKLLQAAGLAATYSDVFDPAYARIVEDAAKGLDPEPFVAFVETCHLHRPWLWKDPRLWLTLRGWSRWLDLGGIKFIVLDRDPGQAWISHQLRRKIVTPAALTRYSRSIHTSICELLDERSLPRLDLQYEDLLMHPEAALRRINAFLDADLRVQDLTSVYSGRLGVRPHGLGDRARACLIYGKNFSARQR